MLDSLKYCDPMGAVGEIKGISLEAAKAAPPVDTNGHSMSLKEARAMWTLAEGVTFTRKLEQRFGRLSRTWDVNGNFMGPPQDKFHFSLGGSVLYLGYSDKDLDIVVRRGIGWVPGEEEQLGIYMEMCGYELQKFFGGVSKSQGAYGGGRLLTAENILIYYRTDGTGKRVDLFLQNNKIEVPTVAAPPQSNSLGIDDLLDEGPTHFPPLNEGLPSYPPPKHPPPPRVPAFSGLNQMAR